MVVDHDEWTQQCLFDTGLECNDDYQCDHQKYTRKCLRSFVPWRIEYSRVRCCFYCCLQFWLHKLNISTTNKVEILMSFDDQGTWQLADYRLSLAQRKHSVLSSQEPETFSFLQPPQARNPVSTKKECWVEAALGDGCGGYSGHDFGRERRAVLSALEHEILSSMQTILVTRDDCETPIESASYLLNHPNLTAWYTTNPNDWKTKTEIKKLRAAPIGVRDVQHWIKPLTEGHAQNRSTLLMCCCMSHVLPSEAIKRLDRKSVAGQAYYRGDLLNRSAYEALYLRKQMHVSLEAFLRRVRRSLIILALQNNGFHECALSHLGFDAYSELMFNSKFVVSPHGNGRACHREYEALAAGAIPLVDYDDSPAMAHLLNGLPLIRVQDWTAITPVFLEREYIRISKAAEEHKIGLSKIYVPYWLDRFTQYENSSLFVD